MMFNLWFLVPLLQAPSLLLILLIISIVPHLICEQLYIRETGHYLGSCIRDHLYNICKKDLSKPVSHLFNSSNHSVSNFVAFIYLSSTVAAIVAKPKRCKVLIHILGTLNPHKINVASCLINLLKLFIFLTYFFSHISILLFPFVFLMYLSYCDICIFASLYDHLSIISHTFTVMKDCSLKCQIFPTKVNAIKD